LRSAEEVEKLVLTKEAVERVIAGLLAGEVAQTIFSKGQRNDAGKSNDIERATMIAQKAVLEFGLSDAWGNRSVTKDQISALSEADRNLLNNEIKKIMNRSRNLAYNTILQNREVFSELAYQLIEKGEIRSQGLEEFYAKNSSRLVQIRDQEKASTKVDAKLLPAGYNDPDYRKSHNVEPADFFTVPPTIANIAQIVKDERAAEVAKARKPKTAPILENFKDTMVKPVLVVAPEHVEKPELQKAAKKPSPEGLSCSRLFS
jgi:hypothetical protein